jgi:hypothetical protein
MRGVALDCLQDVEAIHLGLIAVCTMRTHQLDTAPPLGLNRSGHDVVYARRWYLFSHFHFPTLQKLAPVFSAGDSFPTR